MTHHPNIISHPSRKNAKPALMAQHTAIRSASRLMPSKKVSNHALNTLARTLLNSKSS